MTEAYWCPDWYPSGPKEVPCDRFFTAGTYILDVDAHDRELEMPWEGDPDEVACREHDSKPDRVSAQEWDARLGRARALAATRAWKIPLAEPWEDRLAIGPVVGYWGRECGASRGYESCRQSVQLVAIERGDRTYYKAICPDILQRARSARPDDPFIARDLANSSHINICVPYLPPNH
jgi:hypothetical protein